MKNSLKWLVSALVLIFSAFGLSASAQTWPTKPIRIVIPFAPGGGTDILVRIMVPKLTEILGQPVVVDNKPGGSSIIGTQLVAQAAPDGYTLLAVDSSIVVNPGLRKLPYETEKDLVPIIHLASGPVILVAHPSLPANNLKELIALAKQKPGSLFYGSGGNGASTHLAGELFNMVAGVNIAHVPYKGTGEALSAVMAGTVPLTFTGISSARAPIEAGRLKALAITGSARNAAVPNVPTFDQAGLAGVDSSSQWTVLGPTGMPADVIKKINEAFNQAMKDPAIQKRVDDLGYTVAGGSPVQARKLISDEIAKWKKIISAANININ